MINDIEESKDDSLFIKCPRCQGRYRLESNTTINNKCPYCNYEKLIVGHNDFRTTNPELLPEYSPNNKKKPEGLMKNSQIPVLWICPKCRQEYRWKICDRQLGDNACLYCRNIKVLTGYNDLATTNPELLPEYSPNNRKRPESLMKHYNIPVLWICPNCNGEYEYSVNERQLGDDSCPYCSNKRILIGYNDLATTNPELVAEYSPNNKIKANRIMKSYTKSFLWICPICHGEYSCKVCNRQFGDNSCPYCNKKILYLGYNDFATTNPELISEYSPKNELKPEEIMKTSDLSVLWICPKCHNEYEYKMRNRKLGDNSCIYCNKAINSYPKLQEEWLIIENTLIGHNINTEIITSSDAVWWKCQNCSYKYTLPTFKKILKLKRNQNSCPKCEGRRQKRVHYI